MTIEKGMRFGRLVVLEQAEDKVSPSGRKNKRWLCQCDCGNTKITYADNLKQGRTLSCGCLQKERASNANLKHGDTDSRLYGVWCAMKRRCCNPNVPEYRLYGGRGITICDEWRDDYVAFKTWALANGYDPEAPRGACTIDRIDNDSGYSPENCRWVDQMTQMNNVSYNHNITYNGITHTIAEWARIYDMSYCKLIQRINDYGYSVEDALNKA